MDGELHDILVQHVMISRLRAIGRRHVAGKDEVVVLVQLSHNLGQLLPESFGRNLSWLIESADEKAERIVCIRVQMGRVLVGGVTLDKIEADVD